MIIRQVRGSLPCSIFLHANNFRFLHISQNIPNDDEKKRRYGEKLHTWMPEVSQNVDPSNVTKQLVNIDTQGVLCEVFTSRELAFSSLAISRSSSSAGAVEQHYKQSLNAGNDHILLRNLIEGRNQFHADSLITCSQKLHTKNPVNTVPVASVCLDEHALRCKSRESTQTHGNKATDLPTHAQLNELMNYFTIQAPIAFSTGWTYRKATHNVVFENMIFNTRTEGLRKYMNQIRLLKLIVRVLLKNPEFEIFQMTKEISDGRIDVRWHVHGAPRTLLRPLVYFGIWNGYVDGSSIFYVNSSGLYYKHILMQMSVLPSDLKTVLASAWMSRSRVQALIMKVGSIKGT